MPGYTVKSYRTSDGIVPLKNWMGKLRDSRAKAKVLVRIKRMEQGNFGDHKSVGDGVNELRITEGKGYRVYYGIDGEELVILLCGGDKSTQQGDINIAKEFWEDYKSRGTRQEKSEEHG